MRFCFGDVFRRNPNSKLSFRATPDIVRTAGRSGKAIRSFSRIMQFAGDFLSGGMNWPRTDEAGEKRVAGL